ncbi:hypothetical protein [Roseicyclus marinus]|uniref:hypothetical protein n=1 Tax=Roseicyclus marinus TaxID=2161673 RepID=UPI0030C66EE2
MSFRWRFLNSLQDEFERAASRSIFADKDPQEFNEFEILILVEELHPNPRSTVNKLIADWLYVWLREEVGRTAKIIVTEDALAPKGLLLGRTDVSILTKEDLFSTIEGHNILDRVDFIVRKDVSISSFVSDCLDRFNPLSIVEFPGPRWALSSVVSKFLPSVGIELANGMNISRGHHIVIPNGRVGKTQQERYGDKLFICDYPQIPFSSAVKYDRVEFGISANAFVIVSVGREWYSRSAIEDASGFLQMVVENVLNDESCWILVGQAVPYSLRESVEFIDLLDARKIIFIENEDDLVALYRICDAFVMPPIGGGGVASGWLHQLASLCLLCLHLMELRACQKTASSRIYLVCTVHCKA